MEPDGGVFLHVGCGPARKEHAGPGFRNDRWREIRLDIDPAVQPDVLGTMLDMSAVADGSVDAVYSSHNIEHLYAHEVPVALREFHRVLKPTGFAVVTCPDLQSVASLVAKGQLLEPAYVSPAGPIAAIDILYGHRPALAAGNHFMAHRCGFTLDVLSSALSHAGFSAVAGRARPDKFDLWVIASKAALPSERLRALAEHHLPAA